MALGGGTFTNQNKVLPGSYINFISLTKASASVSDRGVACIPAELNWGADGMIEIESGDFQTDSLSILGYSYTADEMKNIREVFRNAKKLFLYRLNGSGVKASNDYGTAKYAGTRGNGIKIVISTNVDDESAFDVITYLDTDKIDTQTVKTASELADNAFVVFNKSAELATTAGTPMTGGTNSEVTGTSYQTFLDAAEGVTFNTMGYAGKDNTTKALFASYTKRMREEVGAKFICVLYDYSADYEGVINLKTEAEENENGLVYWTVGADSGADIGSVVSPRYSSLTNKKYDGEYTPKVSTKQSDLEKAIRWGQLVFHKVDGEYRVLSDINSFTSVTVNKSADFQLNQVVRTLDMLANDIAVIFNDRYIGKVINNANGRDAFWGDIVAYCRTLESMQGIQDFDSEGVVVAQGNDKKSVKVDIEVNPTAAMEKLYMTVTVA